MSDHSPKEHKARIERVRAEVAKHQAELQALAEGIAKPEFKMLRESLTRYPRIRETWTLLASCGEDEFQQVFGRLPQGEELYLCFARRLIDWVKALIEVNWWRHVEALPSSDEAKQEAVYLCQLAKNGREQEMVNRIQEYGPNTDLAAFGAKVCEWLQDQDGLMKEIRHQEHPAKKKRTSLLEVDRQIRSGQRKICRFSSLENVEASERWTLYCHKLDGQVTPERLHRARLELTERTGRSLSEINSMEWREFVDGVVQHRASPNVEQYVTLDMMAA
ncbi:MAG TPA: hypothetical protein VKU02_29390 [Gemmataceae bacterium]|nr:hypothetical protein [Gemmataceae bacterium]